MHQYIHIAIDGPVAAGKSTVAKAVAEKLGFVYIDTGAMYRTVTYHAQLLKIDINDETAIVKSMKHLNIQVRPPTPEENHGRLCTVLMNGEDVSWQIRTAEVDHDVSKVATYPKVRHALVKKQREAVTGQNAVMEGRDITYRVLPQADIKIYLTANEVVRAERHYRQLLAMGQKVNFNDVLKELVSRDSQDMSRKTDPLMIVPDAWVIDAGAMSIDEVIAVIAGRVTRLRAERANKMAAKSNQVVSSQ